MAEIKNLQIMSDEDLMDSYVKDDSMAFEILYQRYSGQVVGYLTQKTRSPKSAQDLAPDVFLKLHRSRHQYNKMLPFAPWLFFDYEICFFRLGQKTIFGRCHRRSGF